MCAGKNDETTVDAVATDYPGRASASATLDLFITLLSMGEKTWTRLLDERESLYAYMRAELKKVAAEEGERVSASPKNPISMAMTLTCASSVGASPTMFGSMLFSRCVSGTRVIAPGETQTVGGIEFRGLALSHSACPTTYFTAAGCDRHDARRRRSIHERVAEDVQRL